MPKRLVAHACISSPGPQRPRAYRHVGGGQVFSREHKLFDRFAVELLHADDGHGPDMRDASV